MAAPTTTDANRAGSTVIGEDASFTGRIEGHDVTILGRFSGQLRLTGAFRAGASSRIEADAQAAMAEINGEYDGRINARSVIFGAAARAKGVFQCQRLGIREGAFVMGDFNKSDAQPASTGQSNGSASIAATPPDHAASAQISSELAPRESLGSETLPFGDLRAGEPAVRAPASADAPGATPLAMARGADDSSEDLRKPENP